MKISFIFALSVIACTLAWTQEEIVKGVYFNTEKTSKIKVFKATNGKYYGKIVWLKDGEVYDTNNPDPAKHKDSLKGMLFVKSFTYDSNKKQWTGGTIYDPESGKTYDCFMWFEDGNTDILHVKGYVMGMKFAGREVEWTRTVL